MLDSPTMRAVSFAEFGSAPAITELPVPQPGSGEVLVRVQASSINGFDLGVLGGFLQGVYEYEFPVVLGKDFAGVVAGVGEGVTRVNEGDQVFGVVIRPTLGQGAFSEYAVVSEQHGIARRPTQLDHTRAGALGLAGTAALNAVDAVSPQRGETILISGATGGVGSYAIQLAAARGATVIATARPGAEAAFVTGLGATWTVDPDHLVAQVKAIAPSGVDSALHLAGDGDSIAELLPAGGRLASTRHYEPTRSTLVATDIMADPTPETLSRLAAEVIEGRLRVPLAKAYPLTEAASALTDFTTGTVGKLAITI